MKNNKSSVATAVFFLVILFSFPSISEEKPTAESSDESIIIPARMPLPKAFNFWQKDRDQSSKNGWEYEFEYTGEYLNALRNHDNKHKQIYHDNLNLKLTIDLEKARLGRKGKIYLYVLGNSGGKITGDHLDSSGKGRVGDLQVLSNIETTETIRLYEAYYEHETGNLTVQFGLRDLNADFYNSEYSSFFSNSSFGIGADISLNAPVSIFSVTSPALTFCYAPDRNWTFRCGIWDGYPGTADENKNGFGTRISHRDGFMNIIEAQHHHNIFGPGLPGTVKFGNWMHTGNFDDLMNVDSNGNPVRRQRNWGSYAILDQKIWSRQGSEDQGIGFFIQSGGLTPDDRSLIEHYHGFGLTFTGPFRNRPEDIFGIAWNSARTSSSLREFNRKTGAAVLEEEKVLEIGYQIQLNDWLSIKPGIQYIKSPGADPARSKSRIFGLRFNAAF